MPPPRIRRTVPRGRPAWRRRSVASAWVAPATTGTSSVDLVAGDTAEAGRLAAVADVAAAVEADVTDDGLVAVSTAPVPASNPTATRAATRRRRSGGVPAPAGAGVWAGAGVGNGAGVWTTGVGVWTTGAVPFPAGLPSRAGAPESGGAGSGVPGDAAAGGAAAGGAAAGWGAVGWGGRRGVGCRGDPLECLAELGWGLEAVVGVLGQRSGDHLLEVLGDVGPDGAGPVGPLVHVGGGDGERRRPVERRAAADQLVQAAAQRVQVRTVVDLAGGQLLGGQVADGGQTGVGPGLGEGEV